MIAEKLTIDRLFLKTLQIPWQSSMRVFLGVLMVVMVSGDDTTVGAVLEESVLLPCTCLELDDGFKWQMEEPNRMPVYNTNKTVLNRYKDRVKRLPSENSNNCSVLLTNITAEDQGKYKCIFHSKGTYQSSNVYLNVSARFSVCETAQQSGGEKVFRCDVRGRYREAWIQWTLHGRPLTNLTETKITYTNNTDALTGCSQFNGTLSTKLNWTSKPRCDVKAKIISTTIMACEGTTDKMLGNSNCTQKVRVLLIIIPMVMFGLSLLFLFSKYRSSQRGLRK